jgi:hypothetical protein
LAERDLLLARNVANCMAEFGRGVYDAATTPKDNLGIGKQTIRDAYDSRFGKRRSEPRGGK